MMSDKTAVCLCAPVILCVCRILVVRKNMVVNFQ